MTLTFDNPSPPTVLVVGPPQTLVGGMVSVVRQMLSLDFNGRYHPRAFPTTVSTDEAESLSGRILRHIRHLKLLNDTIRRAKPEIVHLHTCSGFSLYRSAIDLIVAKRLGCRTVLHIHGAAFDKFYASAGTVQRWSIKMSLSQADRVIALSQRWRHELLRMSPEARVVVVENAVEHIGDVPDRSHDGLCRFLLLARMDEWKGIDDLLDAAADIHATGCEFEIDLAGPSGTAGDADVLAGKIRVRGLEGIVHYVGTVHGKKKAELLRHADVYIQPSHHEGMPISLLEALSFSLPIIATRVGAVPEVITDQREGLLVPAHTPSELAEAMQMLARNPEKRGKMGLAAKQLASTRFSLDRFRDDLTSLYDGLIAEAAGRGEEDERKPPCEQKPTSRLPYTRLLHSRVVPR